MEVPLRRRAVGRGGPAHGDPRPPTTSEHAGTPNGDADLPATYYDWDGLRFEETHYSAPPGDDGMSLYFVIATAAEVGDVDIVTSSGVTVGMSLDDVESRVTPTPPAEYDSQEYLDLESWTRPTPDGQSLTDWVSVRIRDGHVDQLFATARSYGA